MIKAFAFWLESIVEDDPLPDEVENIMFLVKENGEFKYLEFRGYEKGLNINSIFFRPLEAEFFSIMGLYHKNQKVFLNRLKLIIDEVFFNEELKIQFKNRNIYLMQEDILEYLFTIN